jgi:hypothetical protein
MSSYGVASYGPYQFVGSKKKFKTNLNEKKLSENEITLKFILNAKQFVKAGRRNSSKK